MVGKFKVWESLRISGSFILKVNVSTSLDEASALTINCSLFSCSSTFVFLEAVGVKRV